MRIVLGCARSDKRIRAGGSEREERPRGRVLRILSALAILAPQFVFGQQVITLDLATAAQHDTVTLLPEAYQVRVASLVPRFSYSIAVSHGYELIAPVKPPGAKALVEREILCENLSEATDRLRGVLNEEGVPVLVADLKTSLALEGNAAGCDSVVAAARSLRDRSERLLTDVYKLAAGEYIIVDVARIEGGNVTKRWQRRFSTGAAGEWHLTYGYAFPFFVRLSSGHVIDEGQHYFAKQIGDTGSRYIVTAESRPRAFDAVPTVMFAYNESGGGDWRWNKLTAGLAVDLTKPVLFVGTSITYGANIQVTFGASFHEEMVLLGRYQVGDTIRTNLTPEQLQENAFRVRPFLAVTIRFDKNPFSTAAGAATGDQKAPQKGSTAGAADQKKKGIDSSSTSAADTTKSSKKPAISGRRTPDAAHSSSLPLMAATLPSRHRLILAA